MLVAIDTNVLAYADGVNGLQNKEASLHVIRALGWRSIVIPAQVLGELFNVLLKKGREDVATAESLVERWRLNTKVVPTTENVIQTAMLLTRAHGISIWDAVILVAAESAGCRLLLSEDMQDGFTWGGVTVVNPFAEERHWLLRAALGERG